MRDRKLSLTTLITLILSVSQPIANLPPLFQASQVLAQTPANRKAEADRLLQQGIEQLQSSQFEAALESWQKALMIYRDIQDRHGEASALINLGTIYLYFNNNTKAIEYFEQSLAIAKENKYYNAQIAALGSLGEIYNSLGDYKKTIEYHLSRLEVTRKIKNRLAEKDTLQDLAEAYLAMQNYPQAIEALENYLVISQKLKDREGEKYALGSLGIYYYSSGNHAKAIEYYRQPLAMEFYQQKLITARKNKNRQVEASAIGIIAIVYDALGDNTKAIEYYEERIKIARELKDKENEGHYLANLGYAYLKVNHYSKAVESAQKGLEIARELKNFQKQAVCLRVLGESYSGLNDNKQANYYYQQLLALSQDKKDIPDEIEILSSLSITYRELGYYTQAIEFAQRHLLIARKLNDKIQQAEALTNLGAVYNDLGNYIQAIEYHKESLKIAQEIKSITHEANSLGELGIAYFDINDYVKALDYYQQFLAIAQKLKDKQNEGIALSELGLVYDQIDDHKKAINYYQLSLAIARELKETLLEANTLMNLGRAYISLGNYTKAIEYTQQGLFLSKKINYPLGKGFGSTNLGLALYRTGKLAEAEKVLVDGIQVWESLRSGLGNNDIHKVSIFDKQASIYPILQQVLIAQNKNDEALEIAERGRSRALLDLLNSRLSNNNSTQSFQLNFQQPTLSLLQQIAKQQKATLIEYSIIADNFKIQGKQVTYESELYIWVIKPAGEVTFRKADLKPLWQKENSTLGNLVITSRNSIGATSTPFRGAVDVVGKPNAPKAKNNLKRLHELLINPIADLLPKNSNDHVIFIPQSSLFLVPFAALQDADGKYLIEKHTILTSPSIQVLDLTHKQKQRTGTKPIEGKDTLIVGNPMMPFLAPKIGETPQQLISLPGAELEANAISKLLKTEPLIGNKATEATIVKRLPQARFIHLATHGIFDDIQGLNSGIALTPSGKEDGLLTASEILDLKLNAELVVLSACDTGRGRISGDGVIGLSRSLISAGVPSVLVSLWSVPDTPTALLMTEFYQNLQKSQDKAQALRQAMLTTMKINPNPVDWAAFTLIGEAE
ncbi:CHAT domain-containing protein [Nostoc punctiforme]|uniref:Transcriptional regulator, Fis family n=1 Tax=Nostoc punctiforme (strain ATCC 29133 / PCC 73102) TaxID=63737 RepID=B2JAM0_NOSP7|nr:CHAT domain-containing protein [Nostoc punctiforme]ACC84974.1 transcriptional regulator, Fis family [Nostoc punctiforme PCC 73102]